MAVNKTIPAGLLNKPITFKQPSSLKNDEGGLEKTPAPYLSTRAYVEGFNQYRTTEAEAVTLIGALDFYVRWASDREAINKDYLINYKGQDYTIHKIESIEQKEKFLRFTAKAKE
jgi:SPP1 family predicted phage head-tail adaptor